MSKENVELALNQFFNKNTPSVISIKGKWGVGKTFFWKKYIETKGVANFYLSLTGISSIEEVEKNLVSQKYSGQDTSIEKDYWINLVQIFKEKKSNNVCEAIRYFWKKFKNAYFSEVFPVVQLIPPLWTKIKIHINVINAQEIMHYFLFSTIKNTIICFDDIERKSDKLDMIKIFGLVEKLKSDRNCKLVLIFNNESFTDVNLDTYEKFRERFIDIEVGFQLSSQEAVDVILKHKINIYYKEIKENILKLNIINIRIIKKIIELYDQLYKYINDSNEALIASVAKTLVLFVWSFYGKEINFDFIHRLTANQFFSIKEGKSKSEELKLKSILDNYEYSYTDALDSLIGDGVKNGFFKTEPLLKEIKHKAKLIELNQSKENLKKSWEPFHNSFKDNEKDVVESLKSGFYNNYLAIDLTNLSGMTMLLRELDQAKVADEIIDHYCEKMSKLDPSAFDLNNYPFRQEIKDQYLIGKLNELYTNFKQSNKTLKELLLQINSGSWNKDDVGILSKISEEEFYEFFISTEGKELRVCINAGKKYGLGFDDQIYKKLTNALRRIGKRSRLNKLRVATYGVEVLDNE